jgi:hypothetical protein
MTEALGSIPNNIYKQKKKIRKKEKRKEKNTE